ncbi:GAF domain-containing SpoIIE family protein phosphatase [Streptomyces corynorhini]|uniref:GAF domain-containing protein n=1 Tax=Streptomyces corynorhini TaxID=2282652 RepID=A0A370B5M4_9ACTN|nr:SpoIIE family protein phosphatase [Streptomyces corynorhini]RDG37110.1 GAF domain-containing protein [Streptomyces corynorhini]
MSGDGDGDGGRLGALRETGLTAASDAGMERFARLAAELVGVPVALVSLLESARQILPGMVGLADPWAESRETPLTHSLCRHVVAEGRPLVLADAREDTRTCASLAIADLGVVGYAGMPLTDGDGHVLGSLCAIDTQPRQWTELDLGLLEDLAAACSAELRLRIVSRQREHAVGEAEANARAYRSSLDRSQLLLSAAAALADTTVLAEVRQTVRDLVTSDLKPVYVGLVLVDNTGTSRLRRLVDETGSAPMERAHETYGLDSGWPTARAARENRTITVTSEAELRRDYAPEAVAAFNSLGLSSAVCVPLPGTVLPLGTLVLGWDEAHEIDIVEQALLASLAGYTARAVEQALFVENRVTAARQMQEAMLTDLPEVAGVELAALYRPAAATDLVGGDWYDAYPLPSAAQGGEDTAGPDELALSIGDITGHDLRAVTLMGQIRSMLRQADLDHPGGGPARAVTAVEHANNRLRIGASGTLVHANLRRCPAPLEGSWELTWTNAGHPPPLIAAPDAPAGLLDEHGMMFFPGLAGPARTENRITLAPGSALLLYTDGLVEGAGKDMDEAINLAVRILADHAQQPLSELLASIVDQVPSPDPGDDIALLALRIPRLGPPGDA